MHLNRRSAGRDCRWSAPQRRLRVEPLEARRLLAITVDTLLDVVDAGDGVTSLREAITTANTTSEDEIDFAVTGEIDLLLGELQITDSLTITGPGRELLTIDAGDGDDNIFATGDGHRIFYISDDLHNNQIDVSISGMVLTGGDVSSLNLLDDGGAIKTYENLTLTDCELSGNSAGYGGGLVSIGSTWVNNSTFSSNKARAYGGAIISAGSFSSILAVTDSSFANNSASSGGAIHNRNQNSATLLNSTFSSNAAHDGGALFNDSVLTLVNSTLSGNTATASGGAVHNDGTMRLSGSTLSGNSADESGGGILNDGGLEVVDSTLSNNSAVSWGGGIHVQGELRVSNSTLFGNSAQFGGGIYGGGWIRNSIVAGSSSGGSLQGRHLFSFRGRSNIVEDSSSFGTHGLSETFTGAPLLAPLADNGGPTMTHALLPGSPAIDAGGATNANVTSVGLAKQSSEFSEDFPATSAVDGDTSTPTHTAIDDANPHWQVALAAEYAISEIILHNRDDCCGSRLRDITVEILDDIDNVVFTSELLNPENVLGGSTVNVGPETLHLDLVELTGAAVSGSKVRVSRTPDPDFSGSGGVGPVGEENVLSLGEVEIFAVDQRGLPRVVDGGSGLRQDIGAYEAQTPPTLLLGDADNNFVVEGGDLLAVTNNFGSTGQANGLLLGDANDDGSVDGGDLLAVTNNFGSTGGQTAAAVLSDAVSDEVFAVYPEVASTAKTQASGVLLERGDSPAGASSEAILLLPREFLVSDQDVRLNANGIGEKREGEAGDADSAELAFKLSAPF